MQGIRVERRMILSPDGSPGISPSQIFQKSPTWLYNSSMYTKFMFKKTMVVVGCLLVLIVLVAHWHNIAKFILFVCRSNHERRRHDGDTGDGDVNGNGNGNGNASDEEDQNSKTQENDTECLRPIRMVKFGKRHSTSECTICLCGFKKGEKIGVLDGCNHCFHKPCIEMWLFSHSNCPLCRHSLVEIV